MDGGDVGLREWERWVEGSDQALENYKGKCCEGVGVTRVWLSGGGVRVRLCCGGER